VEAKPIVRIEAVASQGVYHSFVNDGRVCVCGCGSVAGVIESFRRFSLDRSLKIRVAGEFGPVRIDVAALGD